MTEWWRLWLFGAAALHLGFQATVTLLVYPALAARGRHGDDWQQAHAAHSRRITPLVVVVYGALLPPTMVAVWEALTGDAGWATTVAASGAVIAFMATAAVAAPAHGRLTGGWDERIGVRLLRADVLRLVAAVGCLAGSTAALVE